jgi:hypothetical protein
MSAAYYNKVRRILFSTAHDPAKGFNLAYDWLEQTYRKNLGPREHAGLLAELKFYERYRAEFKLTVAGDMGEHADFSGVFHGAASRFDVTTSISWKKFEAYEPFLSHGPDYKIAIVDPTSHELADVVSLAFRRCSCGGYCLPTFLLLDRETNDDGAFSVANDQLLVEVCTDCEEVNELDRFTHYFMPSLSEHADSHDPDIPEDLSNETTEKYGIEVYKWLRREYCEELMAVAGNVYTVTAPSGDGYWSCNCIFKNSVVSNVFPDRFSADGIA